MHHVISLKAFKSGLGVITAALAVSTSSAFAQSQIDNSLSVNVSLIGSNVITQGEPIVLKYKITNNSSEDKFVEMKAYGRNWLSSTLVTKTGQTVPLSDYARLLPAPSAVDEAAVISPNNSCENYIVLNKWFANTRSGKYQLLLHAELPYGCIGDAKPTSGSGAITANFTFPLTITPPDPVRLQATAQALEKELSQPVTDDPRKITMEIQALFSMPENQAKASWWEVAQNPKHKAQVANELGQLQSTTSADMLAGMFWNPSQPDNNVARTAVAEELAALYNTAAPNLKAHIKQIFMDHGFQVGEKVHLPVHGS